MNHYQELEVETLLLIENLKMYREAAARVHVGSKEALPDIVTSVACYAAAHITFEDEVNLRRKTNEQETSQETPG